MVSGRLALEHAGDVVEEVSEELWNTLISRESIDVNDRMLACLVVDDNVDAKERHSQSLSQRPGQLPNNIIVGWLGHTLYIISRCKV